MTGSAFPLPTTGRGTGIPSPLRSPSRGGGQEGGYLQSRDWGLPYGSQRAGGEHSWTAQTVGLALQGHDRGRA